MSTLDKRALADVISSQRITIPKIQRDYVQGRNNRTVNEIRKNFIQSIVLVLKGKEPAMELDFIYGSQSADGFVPLDGQQRLTTLFLLHWILGVDALAYDKDGALRAKLTYATRSTSAEFCDELVRHKCATLARQALETNIRLKAEGEKPNCTVSTIITQRDWHKRVWKFDPTIRSMLVVIDDIVKALGYEDLLDQAKADAWRANLANITFNFLDLGKFDMTDELYITMNARGKLLSDFDKLKSTIEEEIQYQISEQTTDDGKNALFNLMQQWRSRMDGDWINFFWQRFAADEIRSNIAQAADSAEKLIEKKDKRLAAAKAAEEKMRILLLRLIGIQLIENDPRNDTLVEWLEDSSKLTLLISHYQDQTLSLRSAAAESASESLPAPGRSAAGSPAGWRLDFSRIITEIDALTQGCADATALIEPGARLDAYKPTLTHLDFMLADSILHDNLVICYALLAYLRKRPRTASPAWADDMSAWMRLARNLFENDNTNEQTDNKNKVASRFATAAAIAEHCLGSALPIDQAMADGAPQCEGIARAVVYDETLKAKLRQIDAAWTPLIIQAEDIPYLHGQIGALLDWCGCALAGDPLAAPICPPTAIGAFKAYADKLAQTLDLVDDDRLCPALAVAEPEYWAYTPRNTMLIPSQHRDFSFKRHLRDSIDDKPRGWALRSLIDKWTAEIPKLTIGEYCDHLIAQTVKDGKKDWIWAISADTSTLKELTDWRIAQLDTEHNIMTLQSKKYSAQHDPVLWHLANDARKTLKDKIDAKQASVEYCNSYQETPYRTTAKSGGREAYAEWDATPGAYIINDCGNISAGLSPSDLVLKFTDILEAMAADAQPTSEPDDFQN